MILVVVVSEPKKGTELLIIFYWCLVELLTLDQKNPVENGALRVIAPY